MSTTSASDRTDTDRYGPQGEHVAALLDAVRAMTPEQADAVEETAWDTTWLPGAAWHDAWGDAWEAKETRVAEWEAAMAAELAAEQAVAWESETTRDIACDAAVDAVLALIVRDLIPTEHYDTLTHAFRSAGITVHPDDPEITR